MTKADVVDFQNKHPQCGGADGIVGPNTWAVLFATTNTSSSSSTPAPVPSPAPAPTPSPVPTPVPISTSVNLFCPTNAVRTLAHWLIGNPINVYATQNGWFPSLFYEAGFFRDNNGVYHARQDCLQEYFGYNDFYDDVFNLATSMERLKFPFTIGKTPFMIWCWKGNYLNLGAGGEVGIYYYDIYGHMLSATKYALNMTLSLMDINGNIFFLESRISKLVGNRI